MMGADEKSSVQQDPKGDVQVDSSVVAEHIALAEGVSSTLVSNGSVDIRGRIADKRFTGGWRVTPFIIVNEVAERLAFFAIAVNMVSYLVLGMRQPIPTAVTHVTDWIGAAFMLALLGTFLADAYLGRLKTIIVFSLIYAGMVLLTVSATVDSLRPPPCKAKPCPGASNGQSSFLYVALALIALGTGRIKPCISFFNWFFFAINMGALLGITLLVYVQVKKGWGCGFGVPMVAMICSGFILVAGVKFYRFQKPMGSPFKRFLQVMVASLRNHFKGVEVERETRLYEVETKESNIYGARKLSVLAISILGQSGRDH